ncbi:hypothetical protein AAFF_G00138630 [Aldrovandia affinis]|uniref:Histidine protein methyltransferase 1 homolog n=1 Tax=Aldrovandia affinis TaxID=143900 RepID=A0AAD7X3S3_9TELE|nr:hypothetical protein AAFF_G00138630 [Aldrovandia affinis]
MAFSFNFDLQIKPGEAIDEDKNQKDVAHEAKLVVSTDTDTKGTNVHTEKVKEAKEHRPPLDYHSLLEYAVCETLSLGSLPPIHYLNESVFEQTTAEFLDSEKILSQTVAQRTDLISGVYEGGLKRGAGKVHFQDYNSTVIERLTLPNVLLNCEDEDDDDDDDAGEQAKEEDKNGSPLPKRRATGTPNNTKLDRCRFFSGDWTTFLTQMVSNSPPLKYDLIMTSETIYNAAYYPALHTVFQTLLAQEGLIYLATKAHYFGVGGGLYLFQNFVEQKGVFKIEFLKNVEQGLKRHVVALSFRNPDK